MAVAEMADLEMATIDTTLTANTALAMDMVDATAQMDMCEPGQSPSSTGS